MNFKKGMLAASALGLCLLLGACQSQAPGVSATPAKSGEAAVAGGNNASSAVVAVVGEDKITKGDVEQVFDMNPFAELLEQGAGYEKGTPEYEQARLENLKQTLTDMIEEKVVLKKAKSDNKYTLTDEDKANIESELVDYMDSVKVNAEAVLQEEAEDPDKEITQAQIDAKADAMLKEVGFTEAAFKESREDLILYEQYRDEIVANVAATEEQVKAFYDKELATQKTDYSNEPTMASEEYQNLGTVLFFPTRNVIVKDILIPFDDETKAEIDEARGMVSDDGLVIDMEDGDAATDDIDVIDDTDDTTDDISLVDSLTVQTRAQTPAADDATADDATADDETISDDGADADVTADEAAQEAAVKAILEKAWPKLKPKADDAYNRAKASGADFGKLISELGEDPMMEDEDIMSVGGIIVSENLEAYDPAFIAAALKLQKAGDISEPVATEDGYYVLRCEKVIDANTTISYDEIRDQLQEPANEYTQEDVWKQHVDQLKKDMKVEEHPELLS